MDRNSLRTVLDDSWSDVPTRIRQALWLVLLAALAVGPLFFDSQQILNVMIFIFIFAIFGHGWNVIAGYAGQISLGHAIMFGVGAYVVTILYVRFGVPPIAGLWVAALAAAAVGIALGSFTFRLQSHYFAMATLVAAILVRVVFLRWEYVNGAQGIEYPFGNLGALPTLTFAGKLPYYYLIGGFALAITVLVYRMDSAKLGIYLRAINRDQEAAENAGLNVYRYKLYAMAISSAIAGIAGAMYAQFVLYIDPQSTMSFIRNIEPILMVIIGGVGTVLGPIVGAGIFVPLREFTRMEFSGTSTGLGWVVFGVVLLLVSLYRPSGLVNWRGGDR